MQQPSLCPHSMSSRFWIVRGPPRLSPSSCLCTKSKYPICDMNTACVYHDKNINLKKIPTNLYSNLNQASSLQAIYIRILNSGISKNFLNFLPDRPEAYPDFFQIFIQIGIRVVTWHSWVLKLTGKKLGKRGKMKIWWVVEIKGRKIRREFGHQASYATVVLERFSYFHNVSMENQHNWLPLANEK